MERKLAAILAADVAGYSRHMGVGEDRKRGRVSFLVPLAFRPIGRPNKGWRPLFPEK
jgi:hypothetical protein